MASDRKIYMSIALIIMFFLVTLSFNSYLQAVIVFLVIPLGVFGGMWGHAIQNDFVSIMSSYGFIALTGIPVQFF